MMIVWLWCLTSQHWYFIHRAKTQIGLIRFLSDGTLPIGHPKAVNNVAMFNKNHWQLNTVNLSQTDSVNLSFTVVGKFISEGQSANPGNPNFWKIQNYLFEEILVTLSHSTDVFTEISAYRKKILKSIMVYLRSLDILFLDKFETL